MKRRNVFDKKSLERQLGQRIINMKGKCYEGYKT